MATPAVHRPAAARGASRPPGARPRRAAPPSPAALVQRRADEPAARADALADALRGAVSARDATGALLARKVGIKHGCKTEEAEHAQYIGDLEHTGRGDVRGLFTDDLRREFESWYEFDKYIAGNADHIGDVTTGAGKRFWYRLPADKLTVLGETHRNPDGNVQDVLIGLQTARFMYEPINVLSAVGPDIEYTGTWARLHESDVERTKGMNRSNPHGNWLESAALKCMTAMFMFESGFDRESKGFVDDPLNPDWDDAPEGGYTLGERTAFYYVMAIQIAYDIAQYTWDPVNKPGPLVDESDELKDVYVQHRKMLDAMRETKDSSPTMGIRTLAKGRDLKAMREFATVFVRWGGKHTVELGKALGSKELSDEGAKLRPGKGLTLDDLSPAREALMRQRILVAQKKGYLLVGVGDAHRKNLKKWLKRNGVEHAEVELDLKNQKDAVKRRWQQP